jgi:hypothetical protein
LLQRLRDANILYDRDDQGEFFQLYSPNLGEDFFFEIVGGAAAAMILEQRTLSFELQPRSGHCDLLGCLGRNGTPFLQ